MARWTPKRPHTSITTPTVLDVTSLRQLHKFRQTSSLPTALLAAMTHLHHFLKARVPQLNMVITLGDHTCMHKTFRGTLRRLVIRSSIALKPTWAPPWLI
jgi:hypothetical protein